MLAQATDTHATTCARTHSRSPHLGPRAPAASDRVWARGSPGTRCHRSHSGKTLPGASRVCAGAHVCVNAGAGRATPVCVCTALLLGVCSPVLTHLLGHLHTASSGLVLRCPGVGPRPGPLTAGGQLPGALREIPPPAPVQSHPGCGRPPRPPPGSALAAPEWGGVRGLVPTAGPDPEGRAAPAGPSRLTGWHFPSCLLFLLPDRSTSTTVFPDRRKYQTPGTGTKLPLNFNEWP